MQCYKCLLPPFWSVVLAYMGNIISEWALQALIDKAIKRLKYGLSHESNFDYIFIVRAMHF